MPIPLFGSPVSDEWWAPSYGQQPWRGGAPAKHWASWGKLPATMLEDTETATGLRQLAIANALLPYLNPYSRGWFGTQIRSNAPQLIEAGVPSSRVEQLNVPMTPRLTAGSFYDWLGPMADALRAAGNELMQEEHGYGTSALEEANWLHTIGRQLEEAAPGAGESWTAGQVQAVNDLLAQAQAAAPAGWEDWFGMMLNPQYTARPINLTWSQRLPQYANRW